MTFSVTASAAGLHSLTAGKGTYKSMARDFLRHHNQARVGFSEPPLVWDRSLARYARRHAGRRKLDCGMVHSMGPYGENIFWGTGWEWTASDAVATWVNEHRFYNVTDNTCAPRETCGHYTQVVWKDSLRVGCARVECLNGGVFVSCNYDPPGNWVGESPFGVGVVAVAATAVQGRLVSGPGRLG
ncbi:hypothetical protein QJS04_geneDACA024461 [Acorus gramineus]|uniref:SCP domain-containing protein n=1 Tax=Acorus gramineus TaxID=55184 RepID=A0AAV9A099_ACOGR|nr:hypothetical protein QJS04_geneDACA023409 [Acorus gramineus]KAK1257356.1 hypothetical protein QJS04_geneDACA024461 [Acorus gramineus]